MEVQLEEGTQLKTKWTANEYGLTMLAIPITFNNTTSFYRNYRLTIQLVDEEGFLLAVKGFHPGENNYILNKENHQFPRDMEVKPQTTSTFRGNVEVSGAEQRAMNEDKTVWDLEKTTEYEI